MFIKMCEHQDIVAKLVRASTSPCIVVSFHKSDPHVVWQFDLGKNPNFTIMLRDGERGCNFGVTSPEGIFTPVAHFATREDAENAYAAVHKALMKQGCCGISSGWGRLALILVGLFLLFVLFASIVHRTSSTGKGNAAPTAAPVAEEAKKPRAPAVFKPGIPLPADDVLKPPRD